MKHRCYYFIAFLFFLTACQDFFIKDKEFSMKAIPYTGDELKINGYYYKMDDTWSHVLIFYANGVQFGGNSVIPNIEIEDRLRNPEYTKNLHDCLSCWGPYQIKENVLQFEFYDIFGHDWRTCIAHCKILNDTTFNIEKVTFSKTGKEVDVKKEGVGESFLGEYRFKQFNPKPDSTNSVVH